MVDTHSHILWGLDDGPQTRGEALAVCTNAIADGVRTIVATPHLSRAYPTVYAEADARLHELATALSADMPLRLTLGAEITAGLVASLPPEKLRQWSINNGFLLIEVESNWAPRTIDLMSSIAKDASLVPVWAHPERWHAIRHDPGLTRALARRGLIQVTAPSLIGLLGRRVHEAAWQMVRDGSASLLASDVHGSRSRPQALGDAADRIELELGEAHRERLVEQGPQALVENCDLLGPELSDAPTHAR